MKDALIQIQEQQAKEESIVKDRINTKFKGRLDA